MIIHRSIQICLNFKSFLSATESASLNSGIGLFDRQINHTHEQQTLTLQQPGGLTTQQQSIGQTHTPQSGQSAAQRILNQMISGGTNQPETEF